MQPSNNPELCWLFVDSTGTDYLKDELIGVACKRGNDELYAQFRPSKPPPAALTQINGYNCETWEDWDKPAVIKCVADMIDNARLSGHTLIFHSLFVQKAIRDLGIYTPYSSGFGRIQLENMFAPLKMVGLVDGLSMRELCASLDVNVEGLGADSQLKRATELYDRFFETLGLL